MSSVCLFSAQQSSYLFLGSVFSLAGLSAGLSAGCQAHALKSIQSYQKTKYIKLKKPKIIWLEDTKLSFSVKNLQQLNGCQVLFMIFNRLVELQSLSSSSHLGSLACSSTVSIVHLTPAKHAELKLSRCVGLGRKTSYLEDPPLLQHRDV